MSESPSALSSVLLAGPRSGYCLRMLVVGLGMWAASGWFALDAGIKYPQDNAVWSAARQFQKEHGDQAPVLWPDYAKAKGFDPQYNAVAKEQAPHSGMDIPTQWGIAVFTFLAGVGSLAAFFCARRRFVKSEGAGASLVLSNHCGTRLALSEIESMDASQWETKGKAVVLGKAGNIKLDDWKMDTDATDAIFKALVAAGIKVTGLVGESAPAGQGPQ